MSRVTSLPSPASPSLAFSLPCTGCFRHLSASTKTNSHAGPRLATRDIINYGTPINPLSNFRMYLVVIAEEMNIAQSYIPQSLALASARHSWACRLDVVGKSFIVNWG